MEWFRKNVKTYPVGTMFWFLKIIWEPRHSRRGNWCSLIEEHCLCTLCWKEKFIERRCLKQWWIKSCWSKGCKQSVIWEKLRQFNTKHWLCNTRFYNIYCCAKARCEKPWNNMYYLYWWRWIEFKWKTFDEFKNDMYETYLLHCENFWEKNTTIERIDNDKNYCKENCRWATYKEQSNHLSTNKKVEYHWKTYNSVSLMCDDLWLDYNLISRRLRQGRTVKEAVETTDRKRRLHDKQNKKIIYKWEQYYSMADAARKLWINYKMLSRRLSAWWDVDRAIEEPLKSKVI